VLSTLQPSILPNGKEYVSSQMMDASQFRRHGHAASARPLRLIEQPERLIKSFADPKAFGQPDLCAA